MGHIKNIKIENFRGFDKLEISNFGQINLIVGRNNCGKSSLLESIFLSIGMSNPLLPTNINSFRGLNNSVNDLKYIFHRLKLDKVPVLTITTDSKVERKLEIKPKYNQNLKNDKIQKKSEDELVIMNTSTATPFLSGVDLIFTIKEKQKKIQTGRSSFSFVNEREIETKQEKGYQEKMNAVYITSDSKEKNALQRFSEIVIRKKENAILSALQKIDDRIISILPLPDGLYLNHADFEELVPSNIAGDGIRRYLNIVTTVAEKPNSIILIDEIENGLHFSAHISLWLSILSLCKDLNIQLFITTHNIETIKHFSEALENEKLHSLQGKSKAYSLVHTKNEGIKAYSYSYESFKNALEFENEIRN
ncbi:MAG: AAA family ATPase [Bacteroidetes bacterium]|jgi:AAA15 family ATPase/GTPase|nr:AAA family ATPase [Bacteroidota bacterium]MBT6684819.1 AAA family ATPase [Bacteroidota bacterium]MBT7145183.1 AAA family ATPase [Bacteroidota bacterium]MBT7493205.1 AAA family ATPase [Bacteroidota bacterium]